MQQPDTSPRAPCQLPGGTATSLPLSACDLTLKSSQKRPWASGPCGNPARAADVRPGGPGPRASCSRVALCTQNSSVPGAAREPVQPTRQGCVRAWRGCGDPCAAAAQADKLPSQPWKAPLPQKHSPWGHGLLARPGPPSLLRGAGALVSSLSWQTQQKGVGFRRLARPQWAAYSSTSRQGRRGRGSTGSLESAHTGDMLALDSSSEPGSIGAAGRGPVDLPRPREATQPSGTREEGTPERAGPLRPGQDPGCADPGCQGGPQAPQGSGDML